MTLKLRRVLPLAASAAMFLFSACQERLAAPADCPALCPGNYTVRDTVLFPALGSDSSYGGYIQAGSGTSLRISNGLAASDDRALIRFVARPDSYQASSTDTVRPYVIDSVVLSIGLLHRDTAVKNLVLSLYRLPATIDSNFTYTDAVAAFTGANLIDTFAVKDDSLLNGGILTKTLKGAALSKVQIPPGDSGVLAIGVGIQASQPTGVRIGSSSGGSAAPLFTTYFTVTIDTLPFAKTFVRDPGFARYVSQSVPVLDSTLLTVGGAPSARSVLRFPWPSFLKDSAQLLRVTLELVPTAPIVGLPGDTAFLQSRPILADFGGKSPAATDAFYIAIQPLLAGQTDTVRLEVRRAATLWQGANALPPGIMLQLFPEASSFTRATFGSSRIAGYQPRLVVTYALTFPFENP